MNYYMVKMGPKKTRKYPTKKKTTTIEGKRDYQRQYMRDVRKVERETFKLMKNRLRETDKNFHNRLFGKSKKKKR